MTRHDTTTPARDAAEQPHAALPKKYNPADHEPAVSARWTDANAFHPSPDAALNNRRDPYCILIPPPNVTARLHLGHALNNALQDVLVRAHRMKGKETLWMPGTDHAGIATQTVVDKRLKQAGKKSLADYKRDEAASPNSGRPAFIEEVQRWARQYEQEITDQLKEIGCSCDWQRQRFTMDEQCARAVREAFFRLFKDGLIYRGKRLVNWDPATQTALADDEVEMRDVEGRFVYMRYPLVAEDATPDNPTPITWDTLAARGFPAASIPHDAKPDDHAHITVATTRPETYLGDTAVAVNPEDPRAAPLKDLACQLPLVGRIIPIIRDDYVVMPDKDAADAKARMATGFLKVTPAHDPNDYDIGQRHADDIAARCSAPNTGPGGTVNIMAPDATISDKHGWADTGDAHIFLGLSREDAADLAIKEFDNRGLLEKVVPHTHAVGHSYRSHAPIEPYLSDQWYCKVSDDRLVGNAQRALAKEQRTTDTHQNKDNSNNDPDHTLRFTPDRYARTYEIWHDNLRDWCISRQLWWGHRIPVWRKTLETDQLGRTADEAFVFNGLDHAVNDHASYPNTAARITRRSDGATIDAADFQSSEHNRSNETYDAYVCTTDDDAAAHFEANGFERDPDVLDTWFSSALWPLSTLGWPDTDSPLLNAFNPTDTLCTGRDIITLWVSRMVMFNRYFRADNDRPGTVPFRDVYINPIIQDGFGQRMSKSLGNGVDPLDIVHSHGADAMRFVLTSIATATQDVRMPVELVCPHTGQAFEPEYTTTPQGNRVAAPIQTSPADPDKKMVTAYGVASGKATPTDDQPLARNTSTRFDEGRNFVTKLYNATKFALTKLPSHQTADNTATADIEPREATQNPAEALAGEGEGRGGGLTDRWMLSRLAATAQLADEALANYAFADYATAMYDILWRDFCDWYLEAIKPTVESNPTQQAVLRAALDTILRLLHPICPFVTEVLFERLRTTAAPAVPGLNLDDPPADHPLLCLAPWPDIDPRWLDQQAEADFDELRRFTEAVRQVRATNNIPFRTPITVLAPAHLTERIAAGQRLVETLTNAEQILPNDTETPTPEGAIPFNFNQDPCAVAGFEHAVDQNKLRAQLNEQTAKLTNDIASLEKRLANPGYTEKAPAHLVQQTRDQLEQKKAELDAANQRLAALG